MRLIIKNISILKTLLFNFHYFPISTAIKFPVFVSRNTKLNKIKGKVIIEGVIKTGMILIGFGDVPVFDRKKSRTIWNVGAGEILFKGKSSFGHGCKIGCGGKLVFGKNFLVSAETLIICENEVIFGDNVLFSWNCQVMDTDYHKIYYNGICSNNSSPIRFGDKIWIGSRVCINKGVVLSNNTVVASGAVVTGQFNEENILIAGVPARKIKENVSWDY